MIFENHFAAVGIGDVLHVRDQSLDVQELRHRRHFFCFLVDHHRRADAAVRVAAAGNLSPFGLRPVNHVGEIGERAHQRKREPIARRFGDADLFLHVQRQVRQRVTLLQAALFGDVLVAAGERNRLERDERDLLRIFQRETNDRSDLVVIDAVDQRGHQNDVDARFVQVVDRS